MLVLFYRFILSVIKLSHMVGDKASAPGFKRAILEVVVYPIILLGVIAWVVYLVYEAQSNVFDLPSIIAVFAAQEVTIDVLVATIGKKIDNVVDANGDGIDDDFQQKK